MYPLALDAIICRHIDLLKGPLTSYHAAGIRGGTIWHQHLSRCRGQGVLRVTFWRCNKWPSCKAGWGAFGCFAGTAGRAWASPCQTCLPSYKSLHPPPCAPCACCYKKTKTATKIWQRQRQIHCKIQSHPSHWFLNQERWPICFNKTNKRKSVHVCVECWLMLMVKQV